MLFALFGVFLAIALFIFSNYTRRRLLYAGWVRLRRYEFWPSSLFYFPAIIYYIFLCLPYRKLGLLSIVNPGMLSEGMYQAPKAAILQRLANNNSSFIALCAALPCAQKQHWLPLIKTFMKQHSLKFPLVIKPQVAQRGTGVLIVKDSNQLKQTLSRINNCNQDYMVQEYAKGAEYGVLYARLPHSSQGQVISIVYKEPVFVIGDGKNNLKHLILAHPRACLMTRIHFQLHKEKLNEIPAKGKAFRLNPLGTHSRGAIFRSANQLIGKKLSERIDGISKNYTGFYLGRYDLIVNSEKDLQAGKKFKIIELNSVMGEPGHIYDPANSVWQAYSMLFSHCRLAVHIAAANLAIGNKPLSLYEFLITSSRAYRSLF